MSKDRHYIYPEGRCTEPKIRETIRLISDVKNSVCSEGGKAERNVEFKEQIQCILRGIFQRYNSCAVFKSTLNHLQIVSTQVTWLHFWFFITQK